MKKIAVLLLLFVQQARTLTLDYKKIPLYFGGICITGSLLFARDVQKHNNLVPEASDRLHELKTGCGVPQCDQLHQGEKKPIHEHKIVDSSELPIIEKRHRCGIYNTWYYANKGKLAASAGSVWYAVTYASEDIYNCYQDIQLLPENLVQSVFEKTSEKALEATIILSYDPAILGASVGMLCFGTYFYLKYKNNFLSKTITLLAKICYN